MIRVLLLLLFLLVLLFGGVLLLALLLWWLLSRSPRQKGQIPLPEPAAVSPSAPPEVAEEPTRMEVELAPAEEPARLDELERIEGIGPKIAGLLRAAGITTFAQLAATEVDRIEQILEEESPRLRRLADPTTWPEQAALAAAGNWEALEALQQQLRGGRREKV